ncbi:hypothetical protein FA95DRAFT_170099 [Auriscalpium vulgare]|uniref:Uncharacterized protein n=1 Tax=Auriscalpium vulgare TaxID=40419 RepID=A0ACB8R020_9AGAM|nr:hypothetical protein FA95DRAFT_170099 [Auriscalpium vulgare]
MELCGKKFGNACHLLSPRRLPLYPTAAVPFAHSHLAGHLLTPPATAHSANRDRPLDIQPEQNTGPSSLKHAQSVNGTYGELSSPAVRHLSRTHAFLGLLTSQCYLKVRILSPAAPAYNQDFLLSDSAPRVSGNFAASERGLSWPNGIPITGSISWVWVLDSDIQQGPIFIIQAGPYLSASSQCKMTVQAWFVLRKVEVREPLSAGRRPRTKGLCFKLSDNHRPQVE